MDLLLENKMDSVDLQIKYSNLYILYSNLLSNAQKTILEDYYLYNLSISEIATNRNISRSAVEDAINKGKKKLESLDSQINKTKILSLIEELRTSLNKEEILNEMERILKNGI